jgi:hypothetical protein
MACKARFAPKAEAGIRRCPAPEAQWLYEEVVAD